MIPEKLNKEKCLTCKYHDTDITNGIEFCTILGFDCIVPLFLSENSILLKQNIGVEEPEYCIKTVTINPN